MHNVGLTTYATSPKRSNVIAAKLCIILVFFIAAIIFFTLFSLLLASILSNVYKVDYSKVSRFDLLYGKEILLLFLNIALAIAMAYCAKNQTWALLLYFFLPTLTVLLAQLPFINKISQWISLGHVPSIGGIGTASPNLEWYHILVSAGIWIALPLVVGIVRSIKGVISSISWDAIRSRTTRSMRLMPIRNWFLTSSPTVRTRRLPKWNTPNWVIMLVTALIIVYSAVHMLKSAGVFEKYFENNKHSQINQVSSWQHMSVFRTTILSVIIGLIAGFFAGFSGVGGGFIMVPFFSNFLVVPSWQRYMSF